MKAIGLLLAVVLMLAPVSVALAQSAPDSASAPSSAPSSPAPSSKSGADVNANIRTNEGGADVKANIDRSPGADRSPAVRDDRADGSALPRTTAPQRTTVFGLSPAGAIVVAAALLVVVILAIVAMARSGDRSTTYVERDRRF